MQPITDWDDAYDNAGHIPDGASFVETWTRQALMYRQELNDQVQVEAQLDIRYGSRKREVLDLFLPKSTPLGLLVFVHGGYWVRFDKSYWSHCAKAFNTAGWAVALPSYDLCPDVSLASIQHQINEAISAAASLVEGPIILSGHSAGGHLVTSAVCSDTELPPIVTNRVQHVLSISGVHDLRPLLNTALNDKLKLDLESAIALSPALKHPLPGTRLTALVGANERPEFVRQNALLANVWHGLGSATHVVELRDKHHFNVIDFLGHGSTLTEFWAELKLELSSGVNKLS